MKTVEEYADEIRAANPTLPENQVRESAIAHHLSDTSQLEDGDSTPLPDHIDFTPFEW